MTTMTIHDKTYDLDEALTSADLNQLMFLKQKSGMGLKSIMGALRSFGQSMEGITDEEQKSSQALEMMEDETTLNALRGIVWLVRTGSGERGADGRYLSVDEAADGVTIQDFLSLDSGAEEEPMDPSSAVDEGVTVPS